MARQLALEFLRNLNRDIQSLPSLLLLYGPYAFLREYVLEVTVEAYKNKGFKRVSLHLGTSDSTSTLLEELSEPDLFARFKLVTCRISSRSHLSEVEDKNAERGEGKANLQNIIARAAATLPTTTALLVLYEGEKAPAKLSSVFEQRGLTVTCNRPYTNQVIQYARIFAEKLGVRPSASALSELCEIYDDDLLAIYSALQKLTLDSEESLSRDRLTQDHVMRAAEPELFELARHLNNGEVKLFCKKLTQALASGRDPTEILAVEIIPTLRRVLLVASLVERGNNSVEIARTLNYPPNSQLIESAISTVRRLGHGTIRHLYEMAVNLDCNFKNGMIRERGVALYRFALELVHSC